ncbi:MAG: response regulator [Clostridia bacterium]
MKKVLIVDDEYLVRLGLKTTLDWAGHGFDIVGEAANGAEAMALFDKTDPDILLTDIKMPQMDGLRLIEALKAKKPLLYVVILSHYGDFAYAQKAISLGANQYILKSDLNEASLLATLEQLLTSMDAAQSPHRGQESHLRDYVRQFLLLPRGGELPAPERLLEPGLCAVVVCRSNTQCLAPDAQEMFHRSIRAMLENVWPQMKLISAQGGNLLSIALIALFDDAAACESLLQHARRVSNNIRQYYDVDFLSGVSLPASTLQLPLLLGQASRACDACFFSRDSCKSFASATKKVTPAPHVSHTRLSALTGAQDWAKLSAYIQSIFTQLAAFSDIDCAATAYIDFIGFARHLVTRYPVLQVAFGESAKLNYQNFQDFQRLETVKDCVLDIYRSLMDVLTGKTKRYSGAISRCIAFIQAHYMENIALSDAADAVGVSKSYLSLLFKQETQINFSKYLMDYRVEEAKKLLRDTNLHIYEVAERVGFPNPYYFSKVFKEATGVSCKHYQSDVFP